MDLETQILELLLHLQTLKAGQHHSNKGTAADMAQMQADISNVQTAIRRDLAVLCDEVAALQRHMNEHRASNRPQCRKGRNPDKAQ